MLKKGFAIICFLVFLFSQSGYLVYRYTLLRLDQNQESRIDRHDYKDRYLLEIKIPLHLPYYLDQKDFESRNGEITWKGTLYNYVKSKVKADTLYLLCIRNEIKSEWIHSTGQNLKANFTFSHPGNPILKTNIPLRSLTVDSTFLNSFFLLSPWITRVHFHFTGPDHQNLPHPLLNVLDNPPDSEIQKNA
jgi:hypothetical protein